VQQDTTNGWHGPAPDSASLTGLMRDAARHRSVAALSRDIGHELKSVLNVVGLNLALLSRVAATSEPSRADIDLAARSGEVMRRELKRLDASIEAVLQLHSQDDGFQRIDLGACCEQIGLLVAAKAARQRVTMRVTVLETGIMVDASPAQLQNAVLNLVVNALEAMLKGGTLDIVVSGDDSRARVQICDTGPGLPGHVLPEVWQPHQTKGGTGVGLAVTKTIVDVHEGRIAYDQLPSGEGVSFTLDFPRRAGR
jgi:signal transduction histidine kinase